FRVHIAVMWRSDAVLLLSQIEEQNPLAPCRADPDERPRSQNVFSNCRLDPPNGICGESKASFRIETLDRLDQADVAFRNQLGDREAIPTVGSRDGNGEAQVTRNKLVCSFSVRMLAPALCQLRLFLRLQHRKSAKLPLIMDEICRS